MESTLWEPFALRYAYISNHAYVSIFLNISKYDVFASLVSSVAVQKHFGCAFISNHAYISIFYEIQNQSKCCLLDLSVAFKMEWARMQYDSCVFFASYDLAGALTLCRHCVIMALILYTI